MKTLTLRRSVIFGGATVLMAAAWSSYSTCNRRLAGNLRLDHLDVALADIPCAAQIAADYRQFCAPDDLIAELLRNPAMLTALETSCPDTRRAYLQAYAQEEFRTGKFCLAGRVVVSRSERLIAALRMPPEAI